MIYLSGAVREGTLRRPDLGVMLTPQMGNRPDLTGTWWAADTGCFANPKAYSTVSYLAWLDSLEPYWKTCLFATAPDVVGDAAATLDRSMAVLPLIRDRVPAALVAQDGLEVLPVPWDSFDVLFTGGTTAWKLSEAAYGLVSEAKRRRKWVHMGRCNSQRRLVAASVAGYDSADGTYIVFGPDKNLPNVERWLKQVRSQQSL